MGAVVLSVARIVSGVPRVSAPAEAPRAGLLRRVFEAITAAQMARAEHVVAYHLQRTGRDVRQ